MKKYIAMASLAQKQLEKQNIRTVMQVLHGCRKNCRQCKDDEASNFGEPKIIHKEVKRV